MPAVLQVLGRSAGGIARHVAQIVEALDGRDGLRIDVAGQPGLPVAVPKRVHDIVIPRGPLVGHRAAIGRLRRIIVDGRYAVVHAHGLRAGIDAGLAARGRACVVTTVHNLVEPETRGALKAPFYRRSERLVVRLSDRVIAISRQIADRLLAGTKDPDLVDKVELLHLGIGPAPVVERDRTLVRADLGIANGRPLIATAARLRPQKAIDVLLRALVEVPDAALVIAGEGPLEGSLRSLAERLGIGDRVSFLGFRRDVGDLIAAADAFCLSSVWEGVPLAAQEAILLGTPVVATDVGGMSELISDRVSGRLVARGDAHELAVALRDVLGAPDEAKAYARAAAEHLSDSFSTRKMLDRLAALYLECAR